MSTFRLRGETEPYVWHGLLKGLVDYSYYINWVKQPKDTFAC